MSRYPATILSTKIVSPNHKKRISAIGLKLLEYNAIRIEFLKITVQEGIENAIFTSKNAVSTIVQNSKIQIQNCFCVGENTKELLEKNNQNVVEVAQNASDLGKKIVENYKNDTFWFFCGDSRRDELPNYLHQNKVKIKEQIVYKTHLEPVQWDSNYEAILFFSPSAVQSYLYHNRIKNHIVFCIGNTTATEVKKYTDRIIVAEKPTIDNVIIQLEHYYTNKNHDKKRFIS